MRVSRAEAEDNRRRILEAATNLFREKGFNGVGLIEIANSVGLTHGGFYAKFDSKTQLEMEATLKALEQTRARWTRVVDRAQDRPVAALLDDYLSSPRKSQDKLCVFATLGADIARRDGRFRTAFAEKLRPMLALLAGIMPGRTEAARRREALSTLSMMIGALVLMRAINDDELALEIAAAVRDRAEARSLP
jgi:TetR/AcrR family transcriptional repressor of nem operon